MYPFTVLNAGIIYFNFRGEREWKIESDYYPKELSIGAISIAAVDLYMRF
jgi:hypothetical protein